MSNLQAKCDLDWGDGTYTFRLTVSGTIELEQKCDAPFTVILNRLNQGTYGISDVRETIRLGLIGGGMEQVKALTLVRSQIDDHGGVAGHALAARAILMGLMFGFEAEPLGKAQAAPEANPNASTPPTSTPRPQSSGSHLRTLMPSRFGNGQQQ